MNKNIYYTKEIFDVLSKYEYVILRGLDKIETPLQSDVDIIVRKQNAAEIIDCFRKKGLLVYLAKSYGGARLFVGHGVYNVKRIDLMWACHYRGINLLDLTSAFNSRIKNIDSKIYVIPESVHASILYAIKNAYGGSEKYKDLLKKYGFNVLTRRNRIIFIIGCLSKRPLISIFGMVAVFFCYLMRFFRPTGLTVTGSNLEILRESNFIMYVFTGRVRECSCLFSIFEARLSSTLCLVANNVCAHLDLDDCKSRKECEAKIFEALRKRYAT